MPKVSGQTAKRLQKGSTSPSLRPQWGCGSPLRHKLMKYSMIPDEDKGSMSGIEIVGFMASASQLVVYSIKITTCLSEIWQRVQDAPLKVRQHLDQIRHLISTARLVEEHHLLQTAHVHTHIKATLEQAKSLSAILEQLTKDYSRGSIRRVWKILKATKEKEILASLDRLEKEKSALLLCISVAQTDLLGQGIQKMGMAEEKVSSLSVPLEDGDREDNQTYTNNNAVRSVLTTSSGQEVNGLYTSNKKIRRKQVPVSNMAKEEHCGSSTLPDSLGKNHESSSSGMHHIYERATSIKSGRQINGDLSKDPTSHGCKHLYKEVRAEEHGRQLNGNVSDLEALKLFLAPPQEPTHGEAVYTASVKRFGTDGISRTGTSILTV